MTSAVEPREQPNNRKISPVFVILTGFSWFTQTQVHLWTDFISRTSLKLFFANSLKLIFRAAKSLSKFLILF